MGRRWSALAYGPDGIAASLTTDIASLAAAAPGPDRPSHLDLASNNPFRNRAATPGTTPPTDPSPSPANPFFARFRPDDPAVVGDATARRHSHRSPSLSQNRPPSRNPFSEPAETMERRSVGGPNRHPPLIASFAPFEPAFASAEGAADQLVRASIRVDARGPVGPRAASSDGSV